MKNTKNRVIAIITTAVVTASIATTVCFTCSALESPSTSTPDTIAFASEHIGFIDGMPNPFTECKTIEEAQRISGIKFAVPEYSQSTILACEGMIEIQIAKDEIHTITIRKSAGEEDISGVYDGKEMQLHSTDGVDVNVRLKDGKFISAYFTGDDGTYSITCDEPLEANEIIAIVDRIVSVNS